MGKEYEGNEKSFIMSQKMRNRGLKFGIISFFMLNREDDLSALMIFRFRK